MPLLKPMLAYGTTLMLNLTVYVPCKSKIKNNMNALEFYKIVAPIVAFTKEGHCFIHTSDETNSFIGQHYNYFPFFVKVLEGKVYHQRLGQI